MRWIISSHSSLLTVFSQNSLSYPTALQDLHTPPSESQIQVNGANGVNGQQQPGVAPATPAATPGAQTHGSSGMRFLQALDVFYV